MINLLNLAGMKDVWLAGLDALEAGQPFEQRVAPALVEYSRLGIASAIEAISSAEGWAKNNPDNRHIEAALAAFALSLRGCDVLIGGLLALNRVLPSVYRKGRWTDLFHQLHTRRQDDSI